MKFQTAISDIRRDGTEIIRGYKLTDLIRGVSFTETIFLILKGELPTPAQT
ncbi:MAG: citrate/2-methylcitrate synthase, partial [Patescibacteria group bacterium]